MTTCSAGTHHAVSADAMQNQKGIVDMPTSFPYLFKVRVTMRCLMLYLSACGSVAPTAGKADAGCIAETDAEFCARIGNACESHTAPDSCGTPRTVDCGACANGQGCVVGVCKTPVCTSFNYNTTPIPQFARSGIEDGLATATSDGQVILWLKSTSTCGAFQLTIADENSPGSGVYTPHDTTGIFNALGIFVGGVSYGITRNGLSILMRSVDGKRLLKARRSALNAVDFTIDANIDFDNVNAQLTGKGGTFGAPVISDDELELIYTIENSSPTSNEIYSSIRGSKTVPFPAGTKIMAAAPYPYATALSSDRLALFVNDMYQGRVLTRKSTSLPFVNPNAPGPPPSIPNWIHRPLTDCSKLIAMASPGGCQNEDIVLMTRQ